MAGSTPPPVDGRSSRELLADVRELAPLYTDAWEPQDDDVGTALLELFAELAGDVVGRLDRVPEKQFVAFLDELGFTREPPQPARVPVAVAVTEGAPQNAVVPAETTVLAPAADDRPEQAFTVATGFEATPARLERVYGVVPRADRIYDHTAAVGGGPTTLFEGADSQEHAFSLGHDELLTLGAGATVVVEFETPASKAQLESTLVWTYYGVETRDGEELEGWHPLDCTAVETQAGVASVELFAPGEPTTTTVGNVESRWLRCQGNPNVTPAALFDLELGSVFMQAGSPEDTTTGSSSLEPDVLLANDVPLDPTPEGDLLRPFGDHPRQLDTFAVASDEAFSKAGAEVTLAFAAATQAETDGGTGEVETDGGTDSPDVSWEYWDGDGWTRLPGVRGDVGLVSTAPDATDGATEHGKCSVEVTVPFDIEPTTVAGHEHHWIRARIVGGGYGPVAYQSEKNDKTETWTVLPTDAAPRFDGLTLEYTDRRRPAHFFTHNSGATGQDLAADRLERLRPFRPLPDADQALYLGYDAPLRDGPLPLFFAVRDAAYEVAFHPRVRWERLADADRDEWVEIGTRDGTESLTERGVVDLSFSEPTVATDRFGHELHWVRARVDGTPFVTAPSVDRPGSAAALAVRLDVDTDDERVVVTNDGVRPVDLTGYRLAFGTGPDPPVGRFPVGTVLAGGESVVVGTGSETVGPVDVDLGFKTAVLPSAGSVVLLTPCGNPASGFGAASPAVVTRSESDLSAAANGSDEQSSQSGGTGNAVGGASDGNECGPAAGDRVVPPACERTLATVPPMGDPGRSPPTLGIHPNTGWAVARRTVGDELLGSSDGTAEQTFDVSEPPVVSAVVEVDEADTLTPSARETLAAADRVEIVTDAADAVQSAWVTWERVSDFLDSGPDDRHVQVDATTGRVTFGDGVRGKIPPAGRDTVRISYETGGGAASNVAAGAVSEFTSSIPFVDGVTNPEAADGGADAETTDSVLARGPRTLRDRNRAVTAADFERVALDASRSLARVSCLPGMDVAGDYTPGWVTVLVVPRSAAPRPTPSTELAGQVQAALESHAPLTLVAGDRLVVRGPSYVEVSVGATLNAGPGESLSALEARALTAVQEYLHPLDGREGEGWSFGTLPCLSDWYALLEGVEGVDHVTDLAVTFRGRDDVVTVTEGTSVPRVAADVLVCSGTHRIEGVPLAASARPGTGGGD